MCLFAELSHVYHNLSHRHQVQIPPRIGVFGKEALCPEEGLILGIATSHALSWSWKGQAQQVCALCREFPWSVEQWPLTEKRCCFRATVLHFKCIHNMSASLKPETKEPEKGATESPLGSRLCGQLYCESKEHTSEIRLTADRHLSCSSY